MLLDVALIRRRRRELGLSLREVARHVSVSAAVIERLEDGTNHNDLPLALVAALADTLAIPRQDIWAQPHPADTDTADDAATVGALLAETGVLTPREALADALAWPLDRLDTALKELDQRLRPLGWMLHHLNGDVDIRRHPGAASPEQIQTLLRHHQARRSLKLSEARLLYRILDGLNEQHISSNNDRVALGRLQNAGLLNDDTEQPTAADEVRYSLLLEEADDGI